MPLDELHEILILRDHHRRATYSGGLEDDPIVGLQQPDILHVQHQLAALLCQPPSECRGQLSVNPDPAYGAPRSRRRA
jgi:hypothetical protein